MVKRIVSAVIGIPLLILIISNGGIVLTLSVLILCLIGLKEFYNAFQSINIYPMKYAGYFFTITLFITFLLNSYNLFQLNFYLLTLSILMVNLFSNNENLINASVTLIGYFYVTFSLFHIVLLSHHYDILVWFAFIIAMATDTFAYFSGYFFGKRKLLPKVSPKKTIEGSIGGIIGSMLLTTIFSYIFLPNLIIHSLILGFFGSILSQLGDLIASKVKRYVGIKDFGKLIPGHGGVIDRFDSVIIIAPFIYYYIIVFVK